MTFSLRSSLFALPLLVFALPSPSLAVEDFADLAERLSPSVVNISTSQTREQTQGRRAPSQTPFDEFFREFFERGQPRGPQVVRSLGSGFIIDASGLIVTNDHVVPEGVTEVEVKLSDGEIYKAEVLGNDTRTDIALLKIDAGKPLPFVSFGDADVIRVGQPVLAIGNPFGLGGTVTAGIVSAINRDIGAGPYDDFIQTDAAINRGSSGGPLFNRDGEVIGVNTVIISPSGGSVGIGFAVPASTVMPVVEQLKSFGETRRGWLGVYIQAITPEIAESLGLDEAKGALVAEVAPDGPAEKAGVRPGDIILRFNGVAVEDHRHLPRLVADAPTGRPANTEIFRNGRNITLKVILGRLEDFERAETGDEPPSEDATPDAPAAFATLGIEFSRMLPVHREAYSIPDDVEGVVITDVSRSSAAARAGLRPGHVIMQIGQRPVTDPGQVSTEVESARNAGRQSLLLLVWTPSGSRFLTLPLEEEEEE